MVKCELFIKMCEIDQIFLIPFDSVHVLKARSLLSEEINRDGGSWSKFAKYINFSDTLYGVAFGALTFHLSRYVRKTNNF